MVATYDFIFNIYEFDIWY